ncbi:MAG: STAS domain-containing protein [Planctomycetes bacterium]|nr:STAS domain-containing protein [Planctomycetota bacterium]
MLNYRAESYEKDILLVHVSGVLDANTAEEFESFLRKFVGRGQKKFAFDVRELTFISSRGLGLFNSVGHDVRARGGRFVLVGAQESIAAIFRLSGLDANINFASDLPSAAKSFA